MLKTEKMGGLGEKLIMEYLSALGCLVEQSSNKFDSEKDIVCDGQKVEVKTQVPYLFENSFTIKPNQVNKCRSVDRLFFISVPIKGIKDRWAGWVFEIDPKKFMTKTRVTKDGREMVLIPRDQEAVRACIQVSDKMMKKLASYTMSEY